MQREAADGFVALMLATSSDDALESFMALRDEVLELESLSLDDY
jgi:hypothetical protein